MTGLGRPGDLGPRSGVASPALSLSRALRRFAVPALCILVGGAAGWLLHGAVGSRSPRQPIAVREGGHRLTNPLIECDQGRDLIQSDELDRFERKIEAHAKEAARLPGVEAVSVYFRELNDGDWFVVGEREMYTPASLRKVPMMIAALREVEEAPELLGRTLPFRLQRDYNLEQTFKPSQTMVPGKEYVIGDLIRRMIIYSDNNAFMLLGGAVAPAEINRVYALLDLPGGPEGSPGEFKSILTYASFFRILYNASYLGADLSEMALGLLEQTEFRNGLVEGVPATVPVAHKFGEYRDDTIGKVQLHDCGIVYVPQHPYLLCVMTRGSSFEYLDDAIASTSRMVYEQVSGQAGGRR
jgi:beta-lactamase class A